MIRLRALRSSSHFSRALSSSLRLSAAVGGGGDGVAATGLVAGATPSSPISLATRAVCRRGLSGDAEAADGRRISCGIAGLRGVSRERPWGSGSFFLHSASTGSGGGGRVRFNGIVTMTVGFSFFLAEANGRGTAN